MEYLVRHYKLAEAQLKIGETEQAIEQLKACLALLPSVQGLTEDSQAIQTAVEFQISVAFLRLAENQNCVHCRDPESCIFPIRGGGVHQYPEASRNAIKYLTSLLERNPEPTTLWLLNVAYMTVGDYPDRVPQRWLMPAEVFESDAAFPRFRNIAPDLGLDLVSLCGGMVVDDLNGDGWLDVMTSTWNTSGQMRCYLSNGDGTFSDTTTEAGIVGLTGGLNMIQADYDNDGDVDILVLRGAWWFDAGRHPNSLLDLKAA